ncbi:uncharacterized protein METZ01_LOCUS374494, partial [marine metagenome]
MNKLKNPLVIVANGEFPSHKTPLEILRQSTSILACDGAADTLIDQGYTPDVILGDLDSLSDQSKIEYTNHIVETPDQSQNDLRKALNYAKDHNIDDIKIIGASGKREDHTFGNIFSILDYKNLKIQLFTNTGIFSCIHKSQKIESFKGQQVSIFTLDNTIKITSNNLKYNFNDTVISAIYLGT